MEPKNKHKINFLTQSNQLKLIERSQPTLRVDKDFKESF